MSRNDERGFELRGVVAGILTWMVPGLGHIYLGHRWRGALFLAVITTTFWGGVAIGGVQNTVDPMTHRAWFVAELCTAGNTAVGLVVGSRVGEPKQGSGSEYLAKWPADDIGIVYCGIAGLLNVLVILDAVARGASGGGGSARWRSRSVRKEVT